MLKVVSRKGIKMSIARKLCIGIALAATWQKRDETPGSDSDFKGFLSSNFYLDIAQRAEAAKLDFVFRPDTLFIDPERGGASPGFASIDPTLMLAAIARETKHIGLVTTASTTFNPPYVIARQMQSLNWLSNGRAGWNIVTSLDGNQNFGLSAMPSSEERYAQAAECTDVVQRLWGSFRGRETGTEQRIELASIDHHGPHYKVKGPLNVPAHPSGRLPLFQAGASPSGRQFAASVADAIFASTPDMAVAAELRADLRNRAVAQGRHGDDIRVLPGLNMHLARSRKEAEDMFEQSLSGQGLELKFTKIEALIGLDLREWPMGRTITEKDIPDASQATRSKTHSDLLRRIIIRDEPTVKDLLARPEVTSSGHWVLNGTVDDAVREIIAWADAGALDGFIALPGGSEQSLDLFMDEVAPRLAEQGYFRTDYSGETLAEHMGIKTML